MQLEKPKNQYAIVLHCLINPPKELSMGFFMRHFNSHKMSTRIGELERRFNKILVKRETKKFINRFGHSSAYTVYTPVLSQTAYAKMYKEVNK